MNPVAHNSTFFLVSHEKSWGVTGNSLEKSQNIDKPAEEKTRKYGTRTGRYFVPSLSFYSLSSESLCTVVRHALRRS